MSDVTLIVGHSRHIYIYICVCVYVRLLTSDESRRDRSIITTSLPDTEYTQYVVLTTSGRRGSDRRRRRSTSIQPGRLRAVPCQPASLPLTVTSRLYDARHERATLTENRMQMAQTLDRPRDVCDVTSLVALSNWT